VPWPGWASLEGVRSKTAEVQLKEYVAMAFGTPVVAYHWPDGEELNRELKELILTAETRTAGMVRSNVRGWHSDTEFFRWDAGCVRVLKKRAETLAIELTRLVAAPTGQARTFRFSTTGWANVLRHGGYNSVHNHPNSMWSGVYYVDRGEPEPTPNENGKLELLDPRSGINMMYIEKNVLDGRYIIDPVPGLMIVFPSWLKHMVHPYFGKGERISVAFNVSVEEKPSESASDP
jgi:uncharacterized protein (TIGR02466 family)